jgi:hypothetical protein
MVIGSMFLKIIIPLILENVILLNPKLRKNLQIIKQELSGFVVKNIKESTITSPVFNWE